MANRTVYNIDSLTLRLPYNQMVDHFASMTLDQIELHYDYELKVLDKSDHKVWVNATYENQQKEIGIIQFDNKAKTALLFIDHTLFYEQLTTSLINNSYLKVNMLGCLEYFLDSMGFDLERVYIENIVLCRDELSNSNTTINLIKKYHRHPEYETIIFDKVHPKDNILVDTFTFVDTLIHGVQKHIEIKDCCYIGNPTGSIRFLSYNKSKQIHITNENYIPDYNEFPSEKPFYRTEITLTGNQLQKYLEDNELTNNGWFFVSDLYPTHLEKLFRFYSNKIIHFRQIDNGNVVNI